MYKRILIVDDEAFVRELLAELFAQAGYEVHTAANKTEVIQNLEQREFQAALVDLRIPGIAGGELIHLIKRLRAETSIVVMTAHPTVDTALEAMHLGVFDYIVKPFRLKEVERVIQDAINEHSNRQQVRQLRERVTELEARLADLSRRERRGKLRIERAAEATESELVLVEADGADDVIEITLETPVKSKNRLRVAERQPMLATNS